MSGYGPHQRALFEAEAATLYEEVVAASGLDADDPRLAEDGPGGEAFALLREIGLVVLDEAEGCWQAVDPSAVQAQVVAPLGQQGAELITESASWARAFAGLTQTWRRSPAAIRGPFTELRHPSIVPFITSLVADAGEELLTAQPQSRRDLGQLSGALEREVAALRRGVRMRTLYQHSARRSSATHEYVEAVMREGAEVRTLDEFFNRLIVVDRRVAVIPGSEGVDVAMVIREPSLVAYLVDIFERSWERGRAFTNHESSNVRAIAAEQRAMTIRMLVGGHADQASAKRLGVSPRTYAGYVADLKAEFDVTTRFQLGYEMGRLGLSGDETAADGQ